MSYDIEQLTLIVEGALLAAGEPLTVERMQTLFEEHEAPSKEALCEALAAIEAACVGRGFNLIEVASGYRFQVREDLASWVNRLWEEKPQKYSRALLETLALIAYRQPITRGDIEEVRGVAVSSHIIKTLTEREWVKVVGHRDVPGRPALYATTRQFLDYFNLKSLDELPTLSELRDIDSLNESLEFDSLPPEIQESIGVAAQGAATTHADGENTDGDEAEISSDASEQATAEGLVGIELPLTERGADEIADEARPAQSDEAVGEPAFDVTSSAEANIPLEAEAFTDPMEAISRDDDDANDDRVVGGDDFTDEQPPPADVLSPDPQAKDNDETGDDNDTAADIASGPADEENPKPKGEGL